MGRALEGSSTRLLTWPIMVRASGVRAAKFSKTPLFNSLDVLLSSPCQEMTDPSAAAARQGLPSGEKARARTEADRSACCDFSFPVERSQKRTVLSAAAEARVLPSGAKTRAVMLSSWPERRCSGLPVVACQSRMDLSMLPEAI